MARDPGWQAISYVSNWIKEYSWFRWLTPEQRKEMANTDPDSGRQIYADGFSDGFEAGLRKGVEIADRLTKVDAGSGSVLVLAFGRPKAVPGSGPNPGSESSDRPAACF